MPAQRRDPMVPADLDQLARPDRVVEDLLDAYLGDVAERRDGGSAVVGVGGGEQLRVAVKVRAVVLLSRLPTTPDRR
jgi:hypothetical protein